MEKKRLKTMLVDTHAHLNFSVFQKDLDQIIKKCLENNVCMINIGTNFLTSQKTIEIAERYSEGVYAAIGLHPINLDTGLVKIKIDELEGSHFEKEFDYEKYKDLAQSKKVVAIGEFGLDYYWKPKTQKKLELFKQKQKDLLLKELKLAKELDLPVIFHCRMAHQDLIEVLKQYLTNYAIARNWRLTGMIHCFTGNWEEAQEYLKMGFYLGFNGLIFKMDFDEIIRKIPLEKILIETDCPYLTPPNFPEERNNPLGVKFVAEKIAEIKNLSLEEVAKVTTENAKNLFKI